MHASKLLPKNAVFFRIRIQSACKQISLPHKTIYFMQKLIILVVLTTQFGYWLSAQNNAVTRNIEYRDGLWYNGQNFVPGDWYSVNGVLTQKRPAIIDTTLHLDKRWVVPPMADAASASLSAGGFPQNVINMYLDEGVMYLQIVDNVQNARKDAEPLLNKKSSLDAVFTNGAVTCSLGYPFLKYEGPANNVRKPEEMARAYEKIKTQRKMYGDAYWFIDRKDDISINWPAIMAQKPGILKIILHNTDKEGGKEGKGLSADIAKAIVKKAHKSQLRVFASVETASDVRLAMKIGVDGLLNLPGNEWNGSGDIQKFELSDDDIKKLAKKKTIIIPSFALTMPMGPNPAIQDFHKKTLKRLAEADAFIAIGSNDEQRTIRGELSYWFNLGVFSPEQMIRYMCEHAALAIFPARKLGKIAEGYEANFLVLNDNPLTNILKIRLISFAVKAGEKMNLRYD
jgi:hypothetical protein